ncbi:MAG: type II toxin-antitoxin system Phd/YefM family antitoxin [Acidobacteriia bacterium]|nr:type II toxin-antitoxin system Phd/YefM family antitoxin [Terriglobia bacterium]
MKTVTFTEFRKSASSLISDVESGEVVVILRHGRPVAEILPYDTGEAREPSWKMPGLKLAVKGAGLSRAILKEREAS